MYIQQDGGEFSLPKGYGGNAFARAEEAPVEPPCAEVAPPPAEEEVPSEPSTPAGVFGKLPFLAALQPPPRRKREGAGLPEWAVIALIVFVLSDSRENDLLPLLLLLLLWDYVIAEEAAHK